MCPGYMTFLQEFITIDWLIPIYIFLNDSVINNTQVKNLCILTGWEHFNLSQSVQKCKITASDIGHQSGD